MTTVTAGLTSVSLPLTATTSVVADSTATITTTTTENGFSVPFNFGSLTTTRDDVKDMVSIIKASKPMPTKTSTTTTTTTTKREEDDIYLKKTLIVEESVVNETKIVIVVVICVVAGIGCVVVVFAYIKYLRKKTRVVLPTILYRPNEPVVIPDFRQTPVMSHRNRMTDLGRYFVPSTISQNSTPLQQQRPKQSYKIEIEDIKFFVPDFEPFAGFDLERFRHIASGVRNVRLLAEPGYKLEFDPLRVFHFFPETNCLD